MPPKEIRRTQRVPRSCFECYSRKVKCSKDIPCVECKNRGIAAECRRESVRVRGHVYNAETPESNPSPDSLLEENARLQAQLAKIQADKDFGSGADQGEGAQKRLHDIVEQYETRLFSAVANVQRVRTVTQSAEVTWPSKACSEFVLDHAALWTDWMHATTLAPHFRQEHERAWSRSSGISSLGNENPLWLAIYFGTLSSALLFMNDAEFLECTPPLYSQDALLRNWYDSAIYFLDLSDFSGRSDIAFIRATAILGLVAVNLGDLIRLENLRACAIRTGQRLNLGWDHLHPRETPIEQEMRRRIWWGLVLCEWLSGPTTPTSITSTDFKCALPLDIDDAHLLGNGISATRATSDQSPRPIQYHIALAKISIVFNSVRSRLYSRRWSGGEIAEIVIAADNELATVIDALPSHLKNDENETDETLRRDVVCPWIPWQRMSLTLVLFYHRMCVNRVLQQYYPEGSVKFARARSICLSSARGILHAAHAVPAHLSRLRSW